METEEKNIELIDGFIDKLVLFFNDNLFVKEIIKKLNDASRCSKIKITNNSIKSFTNSQTREIIIDEQNRKVSVVDLGVKNIKDGKLYFKKEMDYQENGDRYSCIKSTTKVNKKNSRFFERILHYSYATGVSGKQDFCTSCYDVKNYKKDKNGKCVLLDEKTNKNDFYHLANGDVLKVVNVNGNERYFYCDSSVLFSNSNKNDNKLSFNIEIDRAKADEILKCSYDVFALINNDFVYSIRGTSF